MDGLLVGGWSLESLSHDKNLEFSAPSIRKGSLNKIPKAWGLESFQIGSWNTKRRMYINSTGTEVSGLESLPDLA